MLWEVLASILQKDWGSCSDFHVYRGIYNNGGQLCEEPLGVTQYIVTLSGSVQELPKLILIYLWVLWVEELRKCLCVMFINIHHSQLIRSIGINRVLIASCLYSCLQYPLLTLNDYLCRFTVIGQRGMGWKCVSGSVQIHHHCWKNSGTLINMVQRHQSAYVEKQDKDVFLCPWSLIRTEEELRYKIECFKHCRQSNIWFFF